MRMPPDISVSLSRFDGYCDGLKRVGLKYDEQLVYNCEEDEMDMSHIQIGQNGARYFLSLPEAPDAILSANDTMAIGSVIYLQRHSVRVPEDIKVVGYDNIDMCTVVQPNLTTIAQPTKEMGKAAASMIINDIAGVPNAKRQLIYDCELIIREST